MLDKVNRFLMGLVPLVVLCTTGAMAKDVNDFYQRFLDLLQNDRTSELESLLRENRGLASKCLEIIKEKISGETEREKTEAYRLVADELEELVPVYQRQARLRGCTKTLRQSRPSCHARWAIHKTQEDRAALSHADRCADVPR